MRAWSRLWNRAPLALPIAFVACGSFGSEEPAGGAGDAGAASTCTPAAGELVFREGGSQVVDLARAAATEGPAYSMTHGSKPCPISLSTEETTPRWATVVLNATGRTARLEAWGGCTRGNHDLNVVAYVRPTPPVTAGELASCAQASTGFEGAGSPSYGGSGFCKGLVANEGQAVALEACARAVVVFEFGSDPATTSPPPTGVVRVTVP